MMRDVTLVVPVFNALDDTIVCIASLLESDARDCRIIINDDGSPLDVTQRLRDQFGSRPNVEIHGNFRNRGYTANIQYGVEAAATAYVAIVNSDTIFPAVWLGKLLAPLRARPALAAIGPLSNAASYQSIPELINGDGEFSSNPEFGRSHEQRSNINAFLERIFGGEVADVPILNGFCTLFRREPLMRAGGFNPQAFPTGYGEENDLCMRLLAAGHRLGVALDTFVYHAKSKSFGAEKKKEFSRIGRETLERLYGAGFVPEFAALLERNALLSAVRRTVSMSYRNAGTLHFHKLEPGEVVRSGSSGGGPVISLAGPLSAAVWPDMVETSAVAPSRGLALTIGLASLQIEIPAGETVSFCADQPVVSLLNVCAALSHSRDITVEIIPATFRSAAIVSALAELNFGFAYLDAPEPLAGVA